MTSKMKLTYDELMAKMFYKDCVAWGDCPMSPYKNCVGCTATSWMNWLMDTTYEVEYDDKKTK